MKATGIPNGLSDVGFRESDVKALSEGAFLMKRQLNNAPMEIDEEMLRQLYRGAMKYW